MKKTYIAPAFETIEIESTQMIAASLDKGEGTRPGSGALSNDRRGDWGNIWGN